MTKMEPIDPASTKTSLETILTYLERAIEKCMTIQTRDDDKYTWSADVLIAILFGSKIPILIQMAINERGEYTAQEMDPIDLIMSSIDWRKLGLPPMKKEYKDVSLRGEDLSSNQRAIKAKNVFLQMPREVLNKLCDELTTVFSEYFTLEHFPCPNSERNNPLGKLICIQKLIVATQARIVISEDGIDKLIRIPEDDLAAPKGLG